MTETARIRTPEKATPASLTRTCHSGLPRVREFIVSQHIVLYAHSETEVVLLAIKHQRQLVYSAEI